MATSRGQRLGIWIIAGTMMVGTIGGFIAMMVQPGNDARDQARFKQLNEAFSKEMQVHQEKMAAFNATKFSEFSKYHTAPAPFNPDAVTELVTKDLKVGSGSELDGGQPVRAYFIGWKPDGSTSSGMQSFTDDGKALTDPLDTSDGVIAGWTKGIKGMREGGIRELTIPASLAYGDSGKGDIPPNMPLKFILFVVPTSEVPVRPQPSQELLKLYSKAQY